MIRATTRLVALLGHPVAHSVSPAMHNAALAAAGLDLVYVAADVAPGDVETAVAGLVAMGAVGANVTVPHKQAALATCAEVTDRARAVGAVNTLTFTPEGVHGDNTDVAGFLAGLPGTAIARVVVLGAGGAARAVVVACTGLGATVSVVARDVDRAGPVGALGEPGSVEVVGLDTDDLGDRLAGADVVVNATPLGWHGERLPAPFHDLGAGQVAYDLNYRDSPSPFLADAAAAGAATRDGLAMVVGQAAVAFRAWTGVEPDLDAMAAVAHAARADGSG